MSAPETLQPEKDPRKQTLQNLEEERRKFHEEIQDFFNDRTKIAGTGEIGYVKISQTIPREQKAELDRIFDRQKARIEAEAGGKFDQLYAETLAEGRQFVETVKMLADIVSRKEGTNIFSEKEINELGLILKQAKNFSKEHPELAKLLEKLSERRKLEHEGADLSKAPKLSDEDYFQIIDLIDLPKLQAANPSEADPFQQNTLGMMLGLLKPDERVELIKVMMDSDREADAPLTVDALTRLGFLNIPQAEHLFQYGHSEGIRGLETEAELNQYLEKAKSEYPEAQKKVQEKSDQAITELKGKFAVNDLNRFVSMEGVGYVMKIHSIMWLFANFLNHQGDIKSFLLDPYTFAAGGEFVASSAMTEHGGKVGAKWGGLAAVWDALSPEEGPANLEEATAFNELGEMFSRHTPFTDYLALGGAERILELQKKNDLEKNSAPVRYEQLLHSEEEAGTDQQLLALDKAHAYENKGAPDSDKAINQLVEKFQAISKNLGIRNQKNFNQKLGLVKKTMGIET